MDRSFLSDADVIAASREFVCARLLTYESAEEAEFLETLFLGREGTLENTVFTVLAPDGKTRILRPGRTPKMVFGGSGETAIADMAATMEKAAREHPGVDGGRSLPVAEDFREALNLAACDGLPLVALVGMDAASEEKVARLAWSDTFIGRFIYVRVSKGAALEGVKLATDSPALCVIQPGTYGLDGSVLVRSAEEPERTLRDGLARFKAETKDERRHIAEGRRRGIEWETEIPDTDPGRPEGR